MNILKGVKKFFTLFFGVVGYLLVISALLIYSDQLGQGLTEFLIIFYLVSSFVLFIYFRKRKNLDGNKSFKAVCNSFKNDFIFFLQKLKEFFILLYRIIKVLIVIGLIIWAISALFDNSDKIESDAYQKGDMSNIGGSPTYRYSDTPSYLDNEYTTNDESNDQPAGFYGTDTMYACNGSSGNCYDLDVDSDGENIERLYFPKGGWVDVYNSDCEDGYCVVEDENGTEWELEY